METVACDLCGGSEMASVYQVTDTNYGTPGRFTLVQCRACGLVYLNPRPAGAELAATYPRASYHPFGAAFGGSNEASIRTHQHRAAWLTGTAKPGRALDIGSGDGQFLVVLQRLGWTTTGVEPDAAAAAFTRERLGLDVRQGDAFMLPSTPQFDLITLWDVLEHTPSPSRTLRHACQMLAPGGRLALSLPNWDSLERRLFGARWIALDAPRHLYHFSPQTITRLLRRCGFEVDYLTASAPVVSLASNVLRLGGDLAFRRGRTKAAVEGAAPAAQPPASRRALIRAAHALMTLPNVAANLLGLGSSLTIIARKETAA